MTNNVTRALFGCAAVALMAATPAEAADRNADNNADRPDFQTWLKDFRKEARAEGIASDTLDKALTGISFKKRVVELDREQPEFTLTYQEYMDQVVTEERIAEGREKLKANRELLDRVVQKYGVPARFIVALWGIETDYGGVRGDFRVIPALATLTYDGRRQEFFRKEFLHALHILDAGHVPPENMVGSWAGATGQPQFLPSSFRKHAVDFNGDGRKDIWNTKADVFGSAANYLSELGWKTGWTWGRPVTLPDDFDKAKADLDIRKKLAEWAEMGVKRANGAPLPTADIEASVLIPERSEGKAFVVYNNFRVILEWNQSSYFGLAVGQLADAIAGR